MRQVRTAQRAWWVAVAAAALAACSQGGKPAGPAPPPAAGAAAAAAEGPRIATTADLVHLEYQVYGQGEPAVLLVHGWCGNAAYWHAQIDALKSYYTVVALDLAGHGASGANRTDWSIANYAGDVALIARQIPNARLILVGHSMGATVALAAVPRIGARVIGVVAVDALRSVGLPPATPREIAARIAPFRTDFVGATRALVSDRLFERGADPLLVQKVAYDMSLRAPAVAIPTLEKLLALDLTTITAAVHVPVYAINSDLAPTDAPRIRRSLPDFTLDVLPHTGHFLMLEAPQRFNPLLLKDLAALAARAAR
ncbi:MAG TPA: alpha/beta fold hydrolase [Steroidobacteraceae bacterium]|nr:alpha/beta fold hydrolase [Steroidobacteraceae bacterium]